MVQHAGEVRREQQRQCDRERLVQFLQPSRQRTVL